MVFRVQKLQVKSVNQEKDYGGQENYVPIQFMKTLEEQYKNIVSKKILNVLDLVIVVPPEDVRVKHTFQALLHVLTVTVV